VNGINVVEKENSDEEDEAFKIPGFGKVYIEFERAEDAAKAAEAMIGMTPFRSFIYFMYFILFIHSFIHFFIYLFYFIFQLNRLGFFFHQAAWGRVGQAFIFCFRHF
jgi:hypothetical protein